MNRMKERYQKEVVPALMKALNMENVMQVPRVKKVVVNIGLGEAMDNPKALEAAVADLTADHRPETDRHQGPQEHRQLQAARRPGDWRQGDPAR